MNKSSSYPKFTVVGHPNKGKSSIVSALALDDSVQISDTPGTTQFKRAFPLKVDGKIIYELFDTPGFQRARRILAWLQSQEPITADKRDILIRTFIDLHRNDPRFSDEIELLEPIAEGAGILYVVDASKPYGPEYETEMEILRYTGQPSIAILNLIGDEDYREEWKRVLGHYFKMVRTFNPMKATFEDHISLLEGMAHLKEEWTQGIKIAIKVLRELHDQKINETSDAIVKYIQQSLSHKEVLFLRSSKATPKQEEGVKTKYQSSLIEFEKVCEKQIEIIWNHRSVEKVENLMPFKETGLFSQESASVFGLNQKELIKTGAVAGAMTGLGFDAIVGGSSLLLGSILGGAIGGVGAYVGYDKLYHTKVMGQQMGKRELIVGPMQNLNFPYILLGRSLYFASLLGRRSHALRGSFMINNESFSILKYIDAEKRKVLEKFHYALREEKEMSQETVESYLKVIKEILYQLLDEKA